MSIYEGSFCRCCAADGPSRDLITTYNWMGEEEVYADMLRECFDINMDTGEEDGICGVCITQLRNAFNFKKQVQHTEEQFKNKLLFKGKSLAKVKLEIEQNKTSDSETDALDMGADHDSDPEYEVPIKKEPAEAPLKPKAKRRASAAASKAKKVKTEGETSKSMDEVEITVKPLLPPLEKKIIQKQPTRGERIAGLATTLTNPIPIENPKPKSKCVGLKIKSMETKIKDSEIDKHVKNLTTILKHSNATELGQTIRGVFKCPHCIMVFQKPELLKSHVLSEHENDKIIMNNRTTIRNFYANVDVTDLTCKLCFNKVTNLEVFKNHLKTNHQIELMETKNNLIFEFNFSNGFTCTVCSTIFFHFKALSEHMNVHYRYFICDICEHGFATASRLVAHQYWHRAGTLKCDECNEQFDTRVLLNDHMIKHTGEREFQCSLCSKTYCRKKALTEHMKIHSDERRFTCAHCGQQFVKKCSWKNHMKSKHDEIVN